MKEIVFELNGQMRRAWAKPNETLLELLRGKLGIHSPKEGCGRGDCGACTVLLDGRAVRGCLVLALEAEGHSVVTLEGVGREAPSALQKAFVERNVFQCGFCAPGMILAASALLTKNPKPTEREIREALAGNLCRCTGYEPIVAAVQSVAAATSAAKMAAKTVAKSPVRRKSTPSRRRS